MFTAPGMCPSLHSVEERTSTTVAPPASGVSSLIRVEGMLIGRLGANDFWGFDNSEPQTFYSRRIGRAPQLSATGDYTDTPNATTILGAVKLTGKTSSGWSLGFLNAVTGETGASVRRIISRESTGFSCNNCIA